MTDTIFTDIAREFLKEQSTLSLATTAEDGTPRVADLFYFADDDLRIYWISASSSEHSKNIERTSAVAVSIHRPTEQSKEVRGLQMRGTVAVVRDPEQRKSVLKQYIERFQLGSQFDAAIAASELYVFRPTWIRYIDQFEKTEWYDIRPCSGS